MWEDGSLEESQQPDPQAAAKGAGHASHAELDSLQQGRDAEGDFADMCRRLVAVIEVG